MGLAELVDGKQVIAVVDNQFGDTGKGKFSDLLAARWADVIARGTGGDNAGHTVVIGDERHIFHLLPAGILQEDKINILGQGMAINIDSLVRELDVLDGAGISYAGLRISEDAHVVMPYHVAADQKNKSLTNGIGTTGKGIGPCYKDKADRIGIKVRDLLDVDKLRAKLGRANEKHGDIDIDGTIAQLRPSIDRIRQYVTDTTELINKLHRDGKKILLEGAQGLLLSVEYGTYPFVTSSDCSLAGTATGVGLDVRKVDLCLGVAKFPYMTRVGAGPFPTEYGGRESEMYCAAGEGYEHALEAELEARGVKIAKKADGRIDYDHADPRIIELMNSHNAFERGIGVRLAGEEFGATTGRPRRTGPTDLVALRYGVRINGPDLVLTKADVLRGAEQIALGVSHNDGTAFSRDADALRGANVGYQTWPGFDDDIRGLPYEGLPLGLRQSIEFAEAFTGGKVHIVSVGPDRDANIFKD